MTGIISALITIAFVVFIAVCFGKIAGKLGFNPILFGILSLIPIANIIIIAIMAFSDNRAST